MRINIEVADNASMPIPEANMVSATVDFIGRWHKHRQELLDSAIALSAPEFRVRIDWPRRAAQRNI